MGAGAESRQPYSFVSGVTVEERLVGALRCGARAAGDAGGSQPLCGRLLPGSELDQRRADPGTWPYGQHQNSARRAQGNLSLSVTAQLAATVVRSGSADDFGSQSQP